MKRKWWQWLLSEIIVFSICGAVLLVMAHYWHPATRQDIQRMSQQLERANKRIDQLHAEFNNARFEERLSQRGDDMREMELTNYQKKQ